MFVPVNEAFTQIPTEIDQLKNDLSNLIIKEKLTLERLRELNGQNLSRTFGYRPRLLLKTVKNFYLTKSKSSQPQIQTNQQTTQFPNNQFVNRDQNDSSIYDIYTQSGIGSINQDASPVSPKLAQDELFLINNAVVVDRFELLNGVVYLINAYPRYYEKSLLTLLQDQDVNGLAQNLNFWTSRASQSLRLGNENLKNALNAFAPNTYFLPVDQAFSKFGDRDRLNNDTFLFDILFKSHRVSNRILFDYYLDESSPTYYTDTGLPVATRHSRVNGADEIEISIGHVKGRILPEFRNIYCATGVIHLIDTVLGVPSKNAYQEISVINELSSFRALIDRSAKYRQMLDQTPSQSLVTFSPFQTRLVNTRKKRQMVNTPTMPTNNQQYSVSDNRLMTILAPNDASLLAIKDDLLKNDTAIDEFLSNHILIDNSNRVFYTDHDDSVFQNAQTYSTLNPNVMLTAKVEKDEVGVSNTVGFYLASNQAIRTTIVNGNSRVSNGVIHIVDRALTDVSSSDITSLLDKFSTQNTANSPAFSQFVDVLRSTGIFNDLRQPAKKYTLFIPTNEALMRYQDIINSNDLEKKKQLIYRHICLDQNLQSDHLQSAQSNVNQNVGDQLICRNALGQDLTLTKDQSGLVSKWKDNASSKILNDFSGIYSSAYVLESTLLNNNIPNQGLNNLNSGLKLRHGLSSFCFVFVSVVYFVLF